MMLFINAGLLALILISVARTYRRHPGRAPRGLQGLIEPVIFFIRDEVVKPNVGPRYEKFLPYLLTLFFLYPFWKPFRIIARLRKPNWKYCGHFYIGDFHISNHQL